MDRSKVEKAKARRDFLIAEIKKKDAAIVEAKAKLSAINSRVENNLQTIKVIKADGKTKRKALEKRLNDLGTKIQEHQEESAWALSKQSKRIDELREEIRSLVEEAEPNTHESIDLGNVTLPEVEELKTVVDIKRKLLLDLHKHHDELSKNIEVWKNELEQITEKDNALKTKLFETNELLHNLEIEVSALRNTLKVNPQEKCTKSLFDEVNDPRQELHDLVHSMKKKLGELEKEVVRKKQEVIVMNILHSQLEKVFKDHPDECRQINNDFMFAFKNYVHMMKVLCKRLEDYKTNQNKLISKGLPDYVTGYILNLHKQHQKFEETLDFIVRSERSILALESVRVNEIKSDARRENTKIVELSKNIAENEKKINEVKEEYKKHSAKNNDTSSDQVEPVVELNDNNKNGANTDKTVSFDAHAKDNSGVPLRKGGKLLKYKTVFFSSDK